MDELARCAGEREVRGRVVLAHLGSGASLAAVLDGRSIDTSMGFTPSAGLPMSTRSGDLDPGLAAYLEKAENLSASDFFAMASHQSGLLGISETSSDMRDLLEHEAIDVRAAEAVELFCYQAKKWWVRTPPRSAESTRSSSPAASARTRPSSGSESAGGSLSRHRARRVEQRHPCTAHLNGSERREGPGQMLLNSGSLDGQQVLSPATVQLMTSNHLGAGIQNRVAAVEPHRDGFGFGLGVAVRLESDLARYRATRASSRGTAPTARASSSIRREQLVVAFGTAAPGALPLGHAPAIGLPPSGRPP